MQLTDSEFDDAVDGFALVDAHGDDPGFTGAGSLQYIEPRAIAVSRAREPARMRNRGLSNQRPATSKAANASRPVNTERHCAEGAASTCAGAIHATIASNGTIRRSSSSKIDTIRSPLGC